MKTYSHARQRMQRQLIHATLQCLVREGYDRLNVTLIADEAGVGRGTFYRYFTTTDDVLLTVTRNYFIALSQDVHAMMAHYASPEKELRAWHMAFDKAIELKPIFEILTNPRACQLSEQLQTLMMLGFRESLSTNSFLYPYWMNLPIDVMATFTAGAIFAIFRQWLTDELRYSVDEMAVMVHKMLYHTAQNPDRT